jgi:hypothetical protein
VLELAAALEEDVGELELVLLAAADEVDELAAADKVDELHAEPAEPVVVCQLYSSTSPFPPQYCVASPLQGNWHMEEGSGVSPTPGVSKQKQNSPYPNA